MRTNLSRFDNSTFDKGAGSWKILIWYFINVIVFKNPWVPFTKLKVFLLKLFGAKLGKGILIKPCVNIKFPWKLSIGDYVWLGENVWIDNLDFVKIGSHVCISQGALLLTGNHDYTKSTFDYRNGSIVVEEGVWIGAKSVVCPGVTCESHSILAVGSIATQDLENYQVYQGNPAKKIRERKFKY